MTCEPQASAPSDMLLQAEALACRRGARLVCRVPALALQRGQSLWLRGRNGSGKTSLLRVLAGLAAPAEGSLQLAPALQRLYIGHANALKDELSVEENLQFSALLCGLQTSPERLQQALRGWGLWERRRQPARALSQGLRRRCALARLALADSHALWLLDEPFDALDDAGLAALDLALRTHLAAGGACVFSSHAAPALQTLPRELWLDAQGQPA